MTNIVITKHAVFEAQRRGIDIENIMSVIENPQQKLPSKKNRVVLQSKYHDNIEDKEMLLRVIVEEEESSIKVISVYRTSRIEKYWIGGG